MPANCTAAGALQHQKMVHPVAEANEFSPFGSLTPDEFYAHHSVSHSSDFITNPKGLKLFTQWWTPLPPKNIIGIVAVLHGYTGLSSYFIELTSVHIAKSGFAVCAIDHQGHGLSEGLLYHLPDINPVINDCVSFFDSFRSRYDPTLPSFLYGESLGGTMALLIALNRDSGRPYDGLVLNGAMCGISDKFKPPWPLKHFLPVATAVMPTWPVVPTRGTIPKISFKVDWKRKLAESCPQRIELRPRPTTAQELLRVSREVQQRFSEVDVPLLIVHGEEDRICDPALVKELYRKAASEDKTLKIYPGMWHQLIGEPDESVELVFGEVVNWLLSRAERVVDINVDTYATGDGGS